MHLGGREGSPAAYGDCPGLEYKNPDLSPDPVATEFLSQGKYSLRFWRRGPSGPAGALLRITASVACMSMV